MAERPRGIRYLRLRPLSGLQADRVGMTNFAEVLTLLAAGGGLTVLLVMAAVPLLMDSHRPLERETGVRGCGTVGDRA
jgi:hypothetical protein